MTEQEQNQKITNFKVMAVDQDTECENGECDANVEFVATCDQTNVIWALCHSCTINMEEGKIFW